MKPAVRAARETSPAAKPAAPAPAAGDPPEVSVGMVVQDAAETLPRALDSLLSQTGVRFQLILVDDGSTDGSADLLRAAAQAHPGRVVALTLPRRGAAAARNAVLKRARGTFLTWAEPEDIALPGRLAAQLAAIRAAEAEAGTDTGPVMVQSAYRLAGKERGLDKAWDDPLRHLLDGRLRPVLSATIARTAACLKVGRFRETLTRGEDLDWMVRFLAAGGRLVQAEGAAVIDHRPPVVRDGRPLEVALAHMLKAHRALMREKGVLDEFPPRRWWEIAEVYRKAGDHASAWRCRAEAVRLDPGRYLTRFLGTLLADLDRREAMLRAALEARIDARLAGAIPAALPERAAAPGAPGRVAADGAAPGPVAAGGAPGPAGLPEPVRRIPRELTPALRTAAKGASRPASPAAAASGSGAGTGKGGQDRSSQETAAVAPAPGSSG